MTNQVRVHDIEAIEAFRRHLIDFNRTLDNELVSMLSHWQSVGEIWQDDMYRRFGEALSEAVQGITRYKEATPDHEMYLSRLVQRLQAVAEL